MKSFLSLFVVTSFLVSLIALPVKASSEYMYYDGSGVGQAVECYGTSSPDIINCTIDDEVSAWVAAPQTDEKKYVILVTDWGEQGFIQLLF